MINEVRPLKGEGGVFDIFGFFNFLTLFAFLTILNFFGLERGFAGFDGADGPLFDTFGEVRILLTRGGGYYRSSA